MSIKTKEVFINNKTYILSNASAIDQFDIVKTLGASFALNYENVNNIDTIIGILLNELLDKQALFNIQEILSQSIEEKGKNYKISIKDFTGEIFSFYRLIAESIKFNLSDFFTYLSSLKTEEIAE